jgi:hypothetical protein
MRPLKRDLKDLDNMKKPIIATLMMIPFLTLGGCATKANNDISQYETLLKQSINNSDFHSELYVFPSEINTENAIAFSYKTREDLFTGSYLLYLVMKYDQNQFDAELNRLDVIKADIEIPNNVFKTKNIIKDTDTSQYVTITQNSRYEYVKYNSETLEIAYVSNQLFTWKETGIKNEYLYKDIKIPTELDDGDNSYNMYYYRVDDIGYYVK